MAASDGGSATAGPTTFAALALAPAVDSTSVSDVTAAAATFSAKLNPGGASTTYHFEYESREAFEKLGAFSEPFSTPESPLGSANSSHWVSASVAALQPETAYAYRVVVHNSVNTIDGAPEFFSTQSAGGPIEPQSCPAATESSPGFRTYLPDCRAYEMVTPAYGGGTLSTWFNKESPPLSGDGDQILGQNLGGFANPENLEQTGPEYGAIYKFSRTSTGWVAEPLEPPASRYAHRQADASYIDASFSRSFWNLGVQATEHEETNEPPYELAVREPTPSGTQFRNLGLPQGAALAGASVDLNRIVYSYESSLYESTVTGAAGPAPVPVSVTDNGELFGCGSRVGSQGLEGTTYNATSSDVETIFFTALSCEAGPAANELYARIGGDETVAVSEPSALDCRACQTGTPSNALYQGASEDGSKAFFLTEQELLPGATGENLYEYDFEAPPGESITLVSAGQETADVRGVARVSADGSRVYFVAAGILTSSPNALGATPQSGQDNLYVRDTITGHTSFVAILASSDASDWKTEDYSRTVETTKTGQFLLLPSHAQLTPDDSSGEAGTQLFEYDAETQALTRVSRGQCPGGATTCSSTDRLNSDGNTNDPAESPRIVLTPQYEGGDPPSYRTSKLSLAEDGKVFFTSQLALTAGAAPGRAIGLFNTENIYEYEDGGVYLISSADEQAPLETEQYRLLGTDLSGNDVYFYTTDQLVPQDTDSQASWYDARTNGGFPGTAVNPVCEGESCKPIASSSPSATAASSASFVGPGNPKPAGHRHKRRRTRRKHHKHAPPHNHRRKGGQSATTSRRSAR
jgi:hypothetical protein